MERGTRILKEHKIRVTPQRLAVFKVLNESVKHLTAEEIHSEVRGNFPAISLGTVYSVLEFFKKKGLIQEIRINFDKSRYETDTSEHHHFLCQKCGNIFNIDMDPCPALRNREVEGHFIRSLQGYFYGICKKCRGSKNVRDK